MRSGCGECAGKCARARESLESEVSWLVCVARSTFGLGGGSAVGCGVRGGFGS